jgi:hypothetical protein
MQRKLLGIVTVDFGIAVQLLFIYSAFVKCLGEKKKEYSVALYQLFIYSYFKKAHDSVRREVVPNLIDFGIP